MIRICFLLSFLLCISATAGAGFVDIPETLKKKAAQFKQNDNLEEWIYYMLDYVYEQPLKRVSVLNEIDNWAWRKPKNEDERAAWLDMLTAQGYYLMYEGNILPSIETYEEAYRFYNAAPFPGTDILEYILKPLGNNYTRLGDYERAAFIHTKALEIARKEGNVRQIAGVYNNLAVVFQMQDMFADAIHSGLAGLQYAPANSSIAGLLHSSLADVYLKAGKTDSAAMSATQAVKILRQPGILKEENAPYWLSSALQMSGDVAFSQHRYKEAQAFFKEGRKVMESHYAGARKREKARLLEKSGRVALHLKEKTDDFDKAIHLLVPGKLAGGIWPHEDQLYGEFMLADALEGKADALVQSGQLKDALTGYMLIFSIERSLRREFFSRATRLLHQKQSHALAEKAMNTAFQLWEQSGDQQYAFTMLNIMEKSKAQVLLEEQQFNMQNSQLQVKDSLLDRQRKLQQAIAYYDREKALTGKAGGDRTELAYALSQIQLQIKRKYPDFFEPVDPSPLFVPDHPGKDLPQGLIVKNFFAGTDHLYIIDLQKQGILSIKRLPDAAQKLEAIHQFVSRYFHNGPQAMQNDPQGYYKQGYQIWRWLWNDTIAGSKYLLVPDGGLGYLPFDALPTDSVYNRDISKWPFLLKKAATGLAYSMQTWLQQQDQSTGKSNGMTGFFISKASEGVELPAVQQEFEAVSHAAKGNYYQNEKATLAAFREQLGKNSILHLSTHASLEGAQQLPAIQLADGPFFLFELYARKFQPGLIMLSACRTGQGMLAEGEGIISLAREFSASGATGIVAGLWNVHDATVAKLTGNFYQQLPAAESPMIALHDAKKAWLEDKDTKQQLKLPYYWAALTYIGHHHTVILEKPGEERNYLKWIGAGGALIILISLLRYSRR